MKKTGYLILVVAVILFSASCSSSDTYTKYTVSASQINNKDGTIHICDSLGNIIYDSVYPFDTNMMMVYYQKDPAEQDLAFENDYSTQMAYYNAQFDRHRYYEQNKSLINNLKVLNDEYGTGESLVYPEELYGLLKKSINFSVISQGKFNIGVGNLSSLWDYYILGSIGAEVPKEYQADTAAQQRVVFHDPSDDELALALNMTPSVSELQSSLIFDDALRTIKFDSISRIDNYAETHQEEVSLLKTVGLDFSKPSLTLGGIGKGEATQLFADKYPDKMYLINSGHSSVKCVKGKPDDEAWDLTVANPYYYEAMRAGVDTINDTMNSADLILSKKGGFDLSTSGYYENYFYAKQADGTYALRHHIIDPNTGYSHTYFASVSVLVEDSGIADMYTTALMNTDSISEAQSLLSLMNASLGQTAEAYFIVNTPDSSGGKHAICYVSSSLYSSFKQSSAVYPDYYPHTSITSLAVIQ